MSQQFRIFQPKLFQKNFEFDLLNLNHKAITWLQLLLKYFNSEIRSMFLKNKFSKKTI